MCDLFVIAGILVVSDVTLSMHRILHITT